MKISTVIFLYLFVTPLSGSGRERKGSSSKRGKFNPKQYREVESSGTETEPIYIGGTGSSGPNVQEGAEPLASENVHFHEMENIYSKNPFFYNIHQHMLSHNSKVHMKIIPNEGPKDFNISKACKLLKICFQNILSIFL
ncbi:unnamed protein product [Meloidogyne enterolobii]|uniref:Uncharacterized protein n=1 Tax=Meloidogyne enterolobii TaxID=390850 RepID=A0ACB1AU90_MELEN